MSQVYEIIRRAGRIPLDELVLRSPQPQDVVVRELRQLENEGLVHISGQIPSTGQMPETSSDIVVVLTSKGISANTA